MKNILIFLLGISIILGCQNKPTVKKIELNIDDEIPLQINDSMITTKKEILIVEKIIPEIDCSSQEKKIKLAFPYGNPEDQWEREVNLPLTGKFTEESHFVTNKDTFTDSRLFPNEKDENIEIHLKRSHDIYAKYDSTLNFQQLYSEWWQKVWTPSEGGEIGQGSVGKIQVSELSPEMEMWFLNMMWAKGHRPKRGTKFLLEANNKTIVVVAGYETGPADIKFLGGITREVHAYLGTDRNSDIKISLLKDQNSPIGPVKCEF